MDKSYTRSKRDEEPMRSEMATHAETDLHADESQNSQNMGNEMPIHMGTPRDREDNNCISCTASCPNAIPGIGLLLEDGGIDEILGRI